MPSRTIGESEFDLDPLGFHRLDEDFEGLEGVREAAGRVVEILVEGGIIQQSAQRSTTVRGAGGEGSDLDQGVVHGHMSWEMTSQMTARAK